MTTHPYPNYTSYELSSMGLDTAQKAHEMNLNISIMTYIRQFEDLKLFPKEIKELRNKAETLIEKKHKTYVKVFLIQRYVKSVSRTSLIF